ncbi:hypothetical protein BKA93DRAFT_779736 [Sparassis latifolia]
MVDERTASVFTWMNPALRNRMQLAMMVSEAQVRQYYRSAKRVCTEQKVCIRSHNHFISQVRPNSNPRPSVQFYNIDSLLLDDTKKQVKNDPHSTTTAKAVTPEDGDMDDGESKPWLDKPRESALEKCRANVFVLEEDIDLSQSDLCDMLVSDPPTPNVPAHENRQKVEGGSDSLPGGNGSSDADWEFHW